MNNFTLFTSPTSERFLFLISILCPTLFSLLFLITIMPMRLSIVDMRTPIKCVRFYEQTVRFMELLFLHKGNIPKDV